MVAISRVNPNFPIPGIDQSSRGFRDNFSAIKTEIEALQGKSIVLTGDVLAGPILIDSGTSDIVIDCTVAVANVAAGGSNLSVQYNDQGVISGSSNFVFIPSTGRVGIGSSTPTTKLDVNGNVDIKDSLGIVSSDINLSPHLYISGIGPDYAPVMISSTYGAVVINSTGGYPIGHLINGNVMTNLSSTGLLVGIGSTQEATRMLDVIATQEDIARFQGRSDYTDHGVRVSVNQEHSTAAVMLEQRYNNSVVGMRVDTQGNLSLHTGESMDAQLSTSSAQILIDRNGQVGIGTTTPRNRLAVNGSMWINSHIESDPPAVTINTPFIAQVVDTWRMSRYRSAEYTVQVTDFATGEVDITNILIMHANGSPYSTIYGSINSAGSLGTLSCQVDGAEMQLIFTPIVASVQIKIDSYYITV